MSLYHKKYLKYKQKYLNLKGGAPLKINIDDYEFELVGQNNVRGYDLVKIKSSEIKNPLKTYEFVCYNSNSQLKFFRLGYYFHYTYNGSQRGMWIKFRDYKGDETNPCNDYAQNTFIHPKLQKFIKLNFNKIKINPSLIFSDNPTVKDDLALFDVNILNHIISFDRCKQIEPFNNISLLCGEAKLKGYNYEKIIREFEKLSNEIESKYNIANNNFVYEYNWEKTDSSNKLFDYYNYKLYSVELHHKNDESIKLKLYYIICNFCFYEGNAFLNDTTREYSWDYFTNLKQETQNEHVKKECKYTDMYAPIFLTTINSKIDMYGLTDFVRAGAYVCKFMDYAVNCSPEELPNKCGTTYNFIADRYYDLYPFNKLANTTLINKIISGNYEEIKSYLTQPDSKLFINTQNVNSLKPPLIYAIENNRLDIVKLLLKEGADINYINKNNKMTSFLYACKSGHVDIINFLLEKYLPSIDINNTDTYNKSPLVYASENNRLDIVIILLSYGAKCDNITLEKIIKIADTSIIDTLLGKTYTIGLILLLASKCNNINLVKHILNKFTIDDINNTYSGYYNTIDFAIDNNNLEIVELLLDKGAVYKKGFIEELVKLDKLDMIDLLIKKDTVDVNIVLINAGRNKNLNVTKFLINYYKQKINFNYIDKNGTSIIEYLSNDLEIVKILLANGLPVENILANACFDIVYSIVKYIFDNFSYQQFNSLLNIPKYPKVDINNGGLSPGIMRHLFTAVYDKYDSISNSLDHKLPNMNKNITDTYRLKYPREIMNESLIEISIKMNNSINEYMRNSQEKKTESLNIINLLVEKINEIDPSKLCNILTIAYKELNYKVADFISKEYNIDYEEMC
jgi:ankyrin repeat protein